MMTLKNPPNTALLIVDMQKGVVAEAHKRDAVVANIARLLEEARREQVPVIWVQHSDAQLVRESDDWRIVPELIPGDAEPLVEKHYGDSFEDTTLETVLSGLGIGRLVVAGAQTDACIRSTLHGAFVRGYDVTLVSDAHTTEDHTAWGAPPPDQVIAHTNLYWIYQTAPGRTAATVETRNVHFGETAKPITRPVTMTRPITQAISPSFIVSNVEQTIAFYRDKLGFETRFQEPERDPFFAIIGRDGAQLFIKAERDVLPVPNHTRHRHLRLDAFVYVPDPDALAAEFADHGAAFSEPLKDTHDGLRGFEISDPDGYVLFFGRPR